MAELTARDHDVNDNWIRCNEVCEWNHTNHTVRLEIHNNRQVVQKLHEPHAAFFHCAKPQGFSSIFSVFIMLGMIQWPLSPVFPS